MNTKFYTYTQNNSGGHFDTDKEKGITAYVIVEAIDEEHANARAESIGLYFNGCDSGEDCECCGDRWNSVWRFPGGKDEGTDVPTIYGDPVTEKTPERICFRAPVPICAVHYLDGRIEWFDPTE